MTTTEMIREAAVKPSTPDLFRLDALQAAMSRRDAARDHAHRAPHPFVRGRGRASAPSRTSALPHRRLATANAV